MVSFWPFRSGANDAASFEKELSQLSAKINKATAQNEQFQQRRRRYKVLWTLYSSFTYILVVAILTLVTGWDQWGPLEYSAIAGSPVLIYTLRTALDAYYNYRIANSQNHLNTLNGQRDQAIKRLKSATKYDSTQQLLEKYGGSPPVKKQQQQQQQPESKAKRQSDIGPGGRTNLSQARTGFAPPPTANIPSRQPPPPIPPPQDAPRPPVGLTLDASTPNQNAPGEEFAPNAFSPTFSRPPPPREPSQYDTQGPKWYDRIMDVVLGEDETQAKNRIALICQSCRLVNGQAPPGTRTLEEVGKWRCSACHAMNGVESEEKKILKQIAADPVSSVDTDEAAQDEISKHEDEDEDEHLQDDDDDDSPPAASTRSSKARQKKKA